MTIKLKLTIISKRFIFFGIIILLHYPCRGTNSIVQNEHVAKHCILLICIFRIKFLITVFNLLWYVVILHVSMSRSPRLSPVAFVSCVYPSSGAAVVSNICFGLVVPLGCFSIGFPQAGPKAVTSARLCQRSPSAPILSRWFRAKLITLPPLPSRRILLRQRCCWAGLTESLFRCLCVCAAREAGLGVLYSK